MIVVGWQLAVAVAALLAVAVAAGALGRLGTGWAPLRAGGRALVQLAAVSLVILAVVRSWWATAVFLVGMVAVAGVTSARRITTGRNGLVAVVAIVAGALPALALMLGSGAVPLTGIAVVPVAGIVVGGAMTATSLAGRRALDELRGRHGEYEAALSLGLSRRDAALLVVRDSAGDALLPALDQTRTVGLVTLPGAFVGVLLGGGSPLQAGAAQALVLVALLAAESVAVAVTVELVARHRLVRPAPPEPAGRV